MCLFPISCDNTCRNIRLSANGASQPWLESSPPLATINRDFVSPQGHLWPHLLLSSSSRIASCFDLYSFTLPVVQTSREYVKKTCSLLQSIVSNYIVNCIQTVWFGSTRRYRLKRMGKLASPNRQLLHILATHFPTFRNNSARPDPCNIGNASSLTACSISFSTTFIFYWWTFPSFWSCGFYKITYHLWPSRVTGQGKARMEQLLSYIQGWKPVNKNDMKQNV
jgi:hypothetical protein